MVPLALDATHHARLSHGGPNSYGHMQWFPFQMFSWGLRYGKQVSVASLTYDHSINKFQVSSR